jgi:F-type H+-transporting ATPase subunit delta
MQGSSRESLARLTDQLGQLIDGGAEGSAVGSGLFLAAGSLRSEPALRRALTDPSSEPEGKAALARTVFAAHVDDVAADLIARAVTLRWAASGNLTTALEQLGVVAVVKTAEKAGEAERMEDELFRFGRIVAESPHLRDALSDRARSSEDKQALVRSLVEGKVSETTMMLAERSVVGAHLTVNRAINEYVRVAAEARNRSVALVRVARPLPQDERRRLADALASEYDRPVHLNVVTDPEVIGGLRIEIGDQVIDGTISSRLDAARRRLVG